MRRSREEEGRYGVPGDGRRGKGLAPPPRLRKSLRRSSPERENAAPPISRGHGVRRVEDYLFLTGCFTGCLTGGLTVDLPAAALTATTSASTSAGVVGGWSWVPRTLATHESPW